jgi:hypothetical protein
MGAVDIGLGGYGIGERAGAGGGFRGENIQAGANGFFADGARERFLIDYFGAGGVDEVCARTHGGEEFRGQQIACLGMQSQVHTDDIGGGGHCGGGGFVLDAPIAGALRGKITAPGGDGHAEA